MMAESGCYGCSGTCCSFRNHSRAQAGRERKQKKQSRGGHKMHKENAKSRNKGTRGIKVSKQEGKKSKSSPASEGSEFVTSGKVSKRNSKRRKTGASSRSEPGINGDRKHHAQVLVRHYPKSDFGKGSRPKKTTKRASRRNPIDVIMKATKERRKKKAQSERKSLQKRPKNVDSSPSRIMRHHKIPSSHSLNRRRRDKNTDKTSHHGKDNSSSSAEDRRSEKPLKQKASRNSVSLSASQSTGKFATSRHRSKKVAHRPHSQYKMRRDKNEGSSSLKNVMSGDNTTLSSSSRPDRRRSKKEETQKNKLNKSCESNKENNFSYSAKTKVYSRDLSDAKPNEQSRRRRGKKAKKRKRTAGKMSESTSSSSVTEEKNIYMRKKGYEPLTAEVKDQRASKKNVSSNSSSSYRIASNRRKAEDAIKPKKGNEIEGSDPYFNGRARKVGRNSERRYQNNKQKQHNQNPEYSGNKSPKKPMQTSSSSHKSYASSKKPLIESPSRKNFGEIASSPSVIKGHRKSGPTDEGEDALICSKRRLKQMTLKHERGGNSSSARWNKTGHSIIKKRQISSVGVSSSRESFKDSSISSTRSRGSKKRSSKTLATKVSKISRRKGRQRDASASGMPHNTRMTSTSESDNGTMTSSNVGTSKRSTPSIHRRPASSLTTIVRSRSKRPKRGKCNNARGSVTDIDKNDSCRRKNSNTHFSSGSTTTSGSGHKKRYHRRRAHNHKSSQHSHIEVEQKRADSGHKRLTSPSKGKASARKKMFRKNKTRREGKHSERLAQGMQSEQLQGKQKSNKVNGIERRRKHASIRTEKMKTNVAAGHTAYEQIRNSPKTMVKGSERRKSKHNRLYQATYNRDLLSGAAMLPLDTEELLKIWSAIARIDALDHEKERSFAWLVNNCNSRKRDEHVTSRMLQMSIGDLPMDSELVRRTNRCLLNNGLLSRKHYERHFKKLQRYGGKSPVMICTMARRLQKCFQRHTND